MHTQKQTQRPSNRKYHIIYKTTCIVTNKYYYGMHSTDNINDGYLGSGQILWKSIKKYGKKNHRCNILEYLPSREELIVREEQLITEDMRKDPLCMNIRNGGTGAYPGRPTAEETRAKLSAAGKGRKFSDEHKLRISKANKGKKMPEEAVRKHKEKMIGRKWSKEHIDARREGQLNSDKFKERYRSVIIHGVEYSCAREAEEALNLTRKQVSNRLTSRFNMDYQYKDSPKQNIKKVGSSARAVVVDGNEYDTKKEAAEALGLSLKVISNRLNSEQWHNYSFKGVTKNKSEPIVIKETIIDEWLDKQPRLEVQQVTEEKSMRNQDKARAIIIDGVEYESIIKASEVLGINDRTICTRLRSKFNLNYQYKDAMKAEALVVVNAKRKKLVARGIEYSSRKDAAEALGICPTLITRYCQSDKYPDFYYKKD